MYTSAQSGATVKATARVQCWGENPPPRQWQTNFAADYSHKVCTLIVAEVASGKGHAQTMACKWQRFSSWLGVKFTSCMCSHSSCPDRQHTVTNPAAFRFVRHDTNQHNALLTEACSTMMKHLPSTCEVQTTGVGSKLWPTYQKSVNFRDFLKLHFRSV